MERAAFVEEVEVDEAVDIGVEYGLTGITALRHVMRRIGCDDARETSHEKLRWPRREDLLRKTSRLSPVLGARFWVR